MDYLRRQRHRDRDRGKVARALGIARVEGEAVRAREALVGGVGHVGRGAAQDTVRRPVNHPEGERVPIGVGGLECDRDRRSLGCRHRLILGHGGIVRRRHGNCDRGRAASAATVAGGVGEAVRAEEARGRRVGHRLVGVDHRRPMAWRGHRGDAQEVSVRVAVVGEDVDRDRRVLVRRGAVIVGHGGIVPGHGSATLEDCEGVADDARGVQEGGVQAVAVHVQDQRPQDVEGDKHDRVVQRAAARLAGASRHCVHGAQVRALDLLVGAVPRGSPVPVIQDHAGGERG